MRFGRRLRQLREEVGSSQQAIADTVNDRLALRWHQTTVAKTEAGQRPIRLREADALAGVFGFTLAEVLTQLDDSDAGFFADELARRAALFELDAIIASLQERAEHLRARKPALGDLSRWLGELEAAEQFFAAPPDAEDSNGEEEPNG